MQERKEEALDSTRPSFTCHEGGSPAAFGRQMPPSSGTVRRVHGAGSAKAVRTAGRGL